MKNAYQIALRRPAWQRLCAILFVLLSFSFTAWAQTATVTPSDPVNPQNFGSVQVGAFSAAKSYAIAASGLTNSITVSVVPGSRFQLSTDASFSSPQTSLELFPTGGNINTTVYARFAPTATGTVNRTLDFQSDDLSGSFQTYTLTGTGTPGTPTLTVNPSSLLFGNQTVNTTSTPQNVTLNGTSLQSGVTVTAPAGYLVSYNGSTYAQSVIVPVSGGNVGSGTGVITNASVQVVFAPTAIQAYNGSISFTSTNAATQTVAVSGTGTPVPANLTVTYSPDPLNFGSAQVGTATGAQSFTVNGSALTSNVTITATNNYQVRIGSNPFSNSAVITPVNGTISNVSVDVRFTPSTTGTLSENVVVTATNAPTRNVAVTGVGTGAPSGAAVNVTPTSIAFGNVTQSGSFDTRFITVSGTNLGTTPITLTPSSSSIQLRNASLNGSFTSGPLTLTPTNGTVSPTTIEVRLIAVANGSFTETITAASGSATPVVVTVTATSNGNISDISITNPNNNTFTFATRPTTASASQSFLISGTNLLQDITVAPAGTSGSFFQVSTDNVNFFSSVTLPRDGNNNVPQQFIYVRFVPGNLATTVNALIRASSSPAPNADVSVTGISEPTVRLLPAIGSFGDTQVKNTQSAPKTIRLESFLLTGPLSIYFPNDVEDPGRNPEGTPQYEFDIVNGGNPLQQGTKPYQYSDTVATNSDGNRIVNLLVRYAPTRVGASTQDLTFVNTALNNGAPFTLLSGNGRATGFAIAEEPSAQSTAQIVRPTGSTTATITFDLSNPPVGQSYGQNRLVIASRTYTLLPTNFFPQDKQNFQPGTTDGSGAYIYGTGSTIEASTGTFVVFSGGSNTFTVSGLDPAQNYYFFAFEFNNDRLLNAENYKVPNNQPQTPLPVELVSFTAQLRDGKVKLDWATAQEKSNKGFDIERSQDGRSFRAIDFVAGQGTSTSRHEYSREDAAPLAGTSYYRLKQIDTDGTFHYSKMVVVHNGGKSDVTVYPNPVVDVLNISLGAASLDTQVVVTDLMGRTVLQGKLGLDGTFSLRSLKAGNYIVTVINGGEKTSHKVVKQ